MSTPNERSKVYATSRWRAVRAEVLLRDGFMCVRCSPRRRSPGKIVHHRIPLKSGGQAFDPNNLELLCHDCHEREHVELKRTDLSEARSAWDMYLQKLVQENAR